MEHPTSYRDYFLVAELADEFGAGREDCSSQSKWAEASLSDRIERSLFSHDDVVLFTTFDFFDFIALEP